jgi:lysine decarboxylase/arginine decarboxylase
MKLTMSAWPILFVSHELNAENDNGFRLREIINELENTQQCKVIRSFTYEDAAEIFLSRADLSTIVLDWDLPLEDADEKENPSELTAAFRKRNRTIPILLLTDRLETENLSADDLARINGCLWKTADTAEFLAGRIREHAAGYVRSIYPEFFGKLVKYSNRYKYAWHTPGHLGGQGFLRSPAGVALYKFFGENMFRSDLSISVPELGSLLDHEGAAGDAERNSARVFGADQTYYVLNGTSTVNQIIWRSRVVCGDIALVDRNCHKSLNYAMTITGAYPVYMIPRRNRRGIIGPVRLSEFSPLSIQAKVGQSTLIPAEAKHHTVKMSALTNSTYDGICYNTVRIREQLGRSVENLHFDEAWYAYAKFHPVYRHHFGMENVKVKPDDPPVFCSQSTHKLLTAFSQASMLHIRNGGKVRIDPVLFNESYMMHGSTSPQYNMIASLDVATRMMADNGEVMMQDIILEAVQLRKEVARLQREFREKNDWFFGMWQPDNIRMDGKTMRFEDACSHYLASHQEPWVLRKDDPWHGFEEIEENYVMLDPIKLTILTPGLNEAGEMEKTGIPASVVTNYLINHNIVCEKTDYYSFLMLNSLGTTRAKQGTLLAALLKFKEDYDANKPLCCIFPELVEAHPEKYCGIGLRDHCQAMHEWIAKHHLLDKMQQAFETIPDQAMKPAEAYRKVVLGEVETVELAHAAGRIQAVMMVPYPPGIPVIMGGEIFNAKAEPILDYLLTRQQFEETFPGYEGDIHGVERRCENGRTVFTTLCLK